MKPRRRPVHTRNTGVKPSRQVLAITGLAHQGDGVAMTDEGKIFVAGTLPGERVEADVIRDRGELVRVLDEAENRVRAPCPHFDACGGCSLQHMSEESYLLWKWVQVANALEAHHIKTSLAPMIPIEAGTRRRATFAAERRSGRLHFGFHSARSHQVTAIESCLILTPELAASLEALRILSAIITPKRGVLKIHALSTVSGLDVRLDDFGDWPDFSIERALIDHAINTPFARLSLGDNMLIETTPPLLSFGKAQVSPPPGGFTQTTQQSEDALARLVLDALKDKKNIVDLFSGSGTFSLRLAEDARVHCVENDAAALDALEKAARKTPALKPVTSEKRDLFHSPLRAKELDAYDAIVLDPPRAGAREQVAEIAGSKVEKAVYVSCSPATFARDAELLIKAGYSLTTVTPVDQFLFSHHSELVGVFCKKG